MCLAEYLGKAGDTKIYFNLEETKENISFTTLETTL